MEWLIWAEDYNGSKVIPKVLPMCGHTFWIICLSGILHNQKIQCPVWNTIQNWSNIDTLPTNYNTLELMQEINTLKHKIIGLKDAGVGMDLSQILNQPGHEDFKENQNSKSISSNIDSVPKRKAMINDKEFRQEESDKKVYMDLSSFIDEVRLIIWIQCI